MKRLLLLIVLLLCAASAAYAQTERLSAHPENGLSHVAHWPFVSGVRVQGDVTADFVLADSGDFNGLYFEMLRGTDDRCRGSLSGVWLEPGWTAEVDASDPDHCSLTIDTGTETRQYFFRFVPQMGEGEWEMERYTITRDGYSFQASIAGLWRMEITQAEYCIVTNAKAAFYWPNDCFNLSLDALPRSIDEARAMERAFPVAAVAPQDARSRVNLREGPSASDPRTGSLYSGTMVRIHGDASGEWLYVNPLEGATLKGYIRRDLLAFGEDIWNVPAAAEERQIFSSDGKVPVSYYPYHANTDAGWYDSGITVSIIGYYNDRWAIAGTWPGAVYLETRYLSTP